MPNERNSDVSNGSQTLEFFASAIPKTGRVLGDELRELKFGSIRPNDSGVLFRGTWEDGWRACLESRIAQRIHVLLARFPAATPEALYAGAHAVDWSAHLTPSQTFAVDAICRGSLIQHENFAALKVKDAVVDQIRAAVGRRPDVAEDPDVRIFAYIANDKATLYLDLSGEPLQHFLFVDVREVA